MDLRDTITDWSLGVVTSGEPDRQDLRNALVRADNAMFTKIAARVATIRKRHGMTLINSTPVANTSATAGPALGGGEHYLYDNAGTEVRYTVLTPNSGRVAFLTDDGSSTSHVPISLSGVVLTVAPTTPDFAVMNNRLLVLDGLGLKASFLGTTQTRWGVSPSTIASAAIGAVGAMTGDYDIAVAIWDAQIGAESEVSEVFSITGVTADKIDLTVTTVPGTVTNLFARIYVRKPSQGPGLYRVLAGTGYTGGSTMGWAITNGAPTAITIDVSDAVLEDSILNPPATGSRGLPPASAKYAAVHNNRLFLADDTHVYWSEQDLPDAFNPVNAEPIRSPKGGYIKGLETVPINEEISSLSVWTKTARHELRGTVDPATWEWAIPDPEMGLVSHRAIIVHDGLVFWWTPKFGPVMRAPTGTEVSKIGLELVSDDISLTAINPNAVGLIAGTGLDQRVIWAVPDPDKLRNTRMVVFNTQMRRWESTKWDPMDVSCLFTSFDTSARAHLVLGGYNGQAFRPLKGSNDGVRAGTVSGTFTAAADTVLSITDGAAAFDVTGAGLIERKVTLLGSDGLVHGEIRPYITVNTATSLTLNEAFTGLTVGAVYTYLIGGPNFAMETFWWNFNEPFTNKRYDFLYLQFRADSDVSEVAINTAFSYDPLDSIEATSIDFTSEHWDAAYWDIANWDSVAVLNRKIGLLKTGNNARVQVRNPHPNQGFEIMKIGILARRLNDVV